MVSDVYLLTKDVWRGVWQSAAESAALGGVITGMVTTTMIKNHQQGRTINRPVRNFILKYNKEEEEKKQAGPLGMLKAQTMKGTNWVMVGESASLANQTGDDQFLQLLEEDMDAEFL